MNRIYSLVALVCVGLARPATAQEVSVANTVWSHLRVVAPGEQVSLVVGDVDHARRRFVAANDREIVVLNVVDPRLPIAVRTALLDLANRNPSYFEAGRSLSPFTRGPVTVDDSGIFYDGRKIVDPNHVIERFDRDAVKRVSRESWRRGTFLGNGGGLIWIAGAVSGGIAGGRLAHSQLDRHKAVGVTLSTMGGAYIGLGLGAVVTAIIDRVDGSNLAYRKAVAP